MTSQEQFEVWWATDPYKRDPCTSEKTLSLKAWNASSAAKWIKVRDQLPELGIAILGYYPAFEAYRVIQLEETADGVSFWDDGEYIDHWDLGDISHWQPLPEPPED
jgi:uncharacterized protein DUF551